ncbi:Pentatricopeptide repeat-containing protein [Glycine soja]|uniref:Pentatricopeptide repeat-containing protein n=1 Tax=Glycine soja TaxID=3848 RepID=A0A0B2QYS3_GLYSO|nr:Pentatricopeptide repeat-containing protein [Glycine soja]
MAKRNMIKTVRDHAIHLDLLAKARGITAAKNYFVNLPESAKNHLCHGAILNCYCKEPMIEKAEGLMEKMKELSLPLSSMPYNSLIMLYTKVGQPEKVSSLIQEMKTSNIMLDSYTYNVWMRALAAVNDISSVERVHDEMKECGCPTYDIRVVNVLIRAYAKLDMLEKAEELKEHARRRGAKPNGKTLEIFMDSYLQKGNFKSTVDCLDEAISMGRWNGEKWVPSSKIIDIMMRNFEQEKDVDGAEEFLEILKKSMESPGVEVFESLTRTYAATGRISSAMLRRLKMENVQVSEGTQKLLEAISEE